MSVLAFERKTSQGIYSDLGRSVFGSSDIVTLSDFKGIADVWMGSFIYSGKYEFGNKAFDSYRDEIIARCRFLRLLPVEVATSLALRAWNGIEELFETTSFDAVFQPMVDNYTLDIVARVAELRSIPVVSFVSHFFNGYFRVSVRGEFNKVRDGVPNAEVEAVRNLVLRDSYKPSFDLMQPKSFARLAQVYYRRKVIERIYYPLMKLWERDPWNYHYNTLLLENGSSAYISRHRYDNFHGIDALKRFDRATLAYFPLHMIPEATTDYWCGDTSQVEYEKHVVGTILNSGTDVTFVVKEHPSMDGWRNPKFYDTLLDLENVLLMPPNVNSNELLHQVDAVVVHTGSVGIEAIMRGKKAFCLTDNYYSHLHPAAIRRRDITAESLAAPTPEHDGHAFMESLLQGLWGGTWYPNKGCRDRTSFDALVSVSRAHLELRGKQRA